MVDAATISKNAQQKWSAWLLAARQGRSLQERGILAADIKVAIQAFGVASGRDCVHKGRPVGAELVERSSRSIPLRSVSLPTSRKPSSAWIVLTRPPRAKTVCCWDLRRFAWSAAERHSVTKSGGYRDDRGLSPNRKVKVPTSSCCSFSYDSRFQRGRRQKLRILRCFPEAAISAAPKASAPMVGAASSDAAMVPPTPDSPASLPSVIFRPGRLIEKTLIETTPMIRAEDGSLVPASPSMPPRHYLPPPPMAPVQSRGQTLAEREFVLPKPMQGGASSSDAPLGASSSKAPVGVSSSAVPSAAQFEDYESVVEAARAAIESASKEL